MLLFVLSLRCYVLYNTSTQAHTHALSIDQVVSHCAVFAPILLNQIIRTLPLLFLISSSFSFMTIFRWLQRASERAQWANFSVTSLFLSPFPSPLSSLLFLLQFAQLNRFALLLVAQMMWTRLLSAVAAVVVLSVCRRCVCRVKVNKHNDQHLWMEALYSQLVHSLSPDTCLPMRLHLDGGVVVVMSQRSQRRSQGALLVMCKYTLRAKFDSWNAASRALAV